MPSFLHPFGLLSLAIILMEGVLWIFFRRKAEGLCTAMDSADCKLTQVMVQRRIRTFILFHSLFLIVLTFLTFFFLWKM